jgi:hypothetical protein
MSLAGLGFREHSAAHVSLSSVFSFQRTDTANALSWAALLLAPDPVECRSRGSLDFDPTGRTRLRQRRAALVGEAYIVAAPSKCQHRFPTFLIFFGAAGKPLGDAASAAPRALDGVAADRFPGRCKACALPIFPPRPASGWKLALFPSAARRAPALPRAGRSRRARRQLASRAAEPAHQELAREGSLCSRRFDGPVATDRGPAPRFGRFVPSFAARRVLGHSGCEGGMASKGYGNQAGACSEKHGGRPQWSPIAAALAVECPVRPRGTDSGRSGCKAEFGERERDLGVIRLC